MKKVFIIFGTRPEAIKMCPLIVEMKNTSKIQTVVCVTGQHREMMKQVLDIFEINPDYDLDIMKNNQSLFEIQAAIIEKIRILLWSMGIHQLRLQRHRHASIWESL